MTLKVIIQTRGVATPSTPPGSATVITGNESSQQIKRI